MPVYEDDTILGAFRKAIRGERKAEERIENPCETHRSRFLQKTRELHRRLVSYEQASARARFLHEQYIRQGERYLTDQDRARFTSIVGAFTLGFGDLHTLVRASDPGRLRPREEESRVGDVMAFLENMLVPDRRAQHSASEYFQTIGAQNELEPILLDAIGELRRLKTELADIGFEWQKCIALNRFETALSNGEANQNR